jgi:hypothetical protein
MQHSYAPSGHRVNLAGLLSAARQPIAGRHRASANARRRASIVALTLLAGLALIVHVGWLTLTHNSAAPRPGGQSAATRLDSAAGDWVRANLPAGIRVLADGFDPPVGYQPVSIAAAGDNWKNYSYLITTTTGDPSGDSELAAVWKSSIPVAVFDDVQIRLILPLMSPDQIRRNRADDRAERLQAGTALTNNPQLVSTPAAKAMLAAGELDLRAAAAVSALVGQVQVTLNKISVVQAEAAAGMPARSITVYSEDPAAVTQALGGLSTAFAPDQVTVGENGAIDLHWLINVMPMPSVN